MAEVFFKEIFEYPITEFKKHFEDEMNERIIFSGKFGSGKTSFLKQFFEANNQRKLFENKSYQVYHLFPVNYSISSNEDIMQYIKYDIIMEMLKGGQSFNEATLRVLDTLPTYIKENALKIISAIVYMIPKIGKDIIESFEKLDKLKEEFLKFLDEANKSEGDKLIEYLEGQEESTGRIYENDVITRILSENIEIGKNEKNSESVLIVDDLDRLDPEHVFRILNVFAAHFDNQGYNDKGRRNKFNFHKIIIVCDLKNIRNIFSHRYGLESDFIGYIDKFFSSDIYQFDNRIAIKNIANKIFDSLIFKEKRGYTYDLIWEKYFDNDFVLSLTTLFILQSYISLRSLIKLYNKPIDYHNRSINFNHLSLQNSYSLPIALQLRTIQDLFGDYEHLKVALIKCLNRKETIKKFGNYFPALLFTYINCKENAFKDTSLVEYDNTRLILSHSRDYNSLNSIQVLIPDSTNPYNVNAANQEFIASDDLCWQILIDTAERLHKVGYL